MTLADAKFQTPLIVINFWNKDIQNRLMDFGLLIGSQIKIEYCAPLCDPFIISLDNSLIQLNKKEAKTIEVLYNNN